MLKVLKTIFTVAALVAAPATMSALTTTSPEGNIRLAVNLPNVSDASIETNSNYDFTRARASKGRVPSIYTLPYSRTLNVPNWSQLWINTGIYAGAFTGTLFVLECLPEDATSWNRAEIRKTPPLERWYRNIFVRNPEIDHDNPVFNYILHPYAGAVYFMSARSSGFNFWRSMLYSAMVSTIGWEFGIEAFMERPSYQDLVITPVVGSIIGECFYKVKRHIVSNDYRLCGSPVLGNIVAFVVDPVNEVIGLFGSRYNTHHLYKPESSAVTSSLMPTLVDGAPGFSFSCRF